MGANDSSRLKQNFLALLQPGGPYGCFCKAVDHDVQGAFTVAVKVDQRGLGGVYGLVAGDVFPDVADDAVNCIKVVQAHADGGADLPVAHARRVFQGHGGEHGVGHVHRSFVKLADGRDSPVYFFNNPLDFPIGGTHPIAHRKGPVHKHGEAAKKVGQQVLCSHAHRNAAHAAGRQQAGNGYVEHAQRREGTGNDESYAHDACQRRDGGDIHMLVLAPAAVDKCALEAVGQPEEKPGGGNDQPKLLGNIQNTGVKNKHVASWRKHSRRHDSALPPDQQGKGALACMDKSIVPHVLAFESGPVQVVDQKSESQLKQQRGKDDCKHFNQPDRQPGQVAQLFKRLFHEYSLEVQAVPAWRHRALRDLRQACSSGTCACSSRLARGRPYRTCRPAPDLYESVLSSSSSRTACGQQASTASQPASSAALMRSHSVPAAAAPAMSRSSDITSPSKPIWRLSTSLIQNDEKPAGLSSAAGLRTCAIMMLSRRSDSCLKADRSGAIASSFLSSVTTP